MTRRALREERGTTLVEMLVTITILSLVMTMLTGTVIFLQRTTNETDQRFDDLGQARLAMDAASKSLRATIRVRSDESPFTVAGGRDVEFYANLSVAVTDVPKRVRLQVVGGDLVESITDGTLVQVPDPEDATLTIPQWQAEGTTRTRTLARGIANAVAEPLFSYFDEDGTLLASEPDGSLSGANQLLVRQSRIFVAIEQSPNLDVPATELSNRVRIPNLYYIDAET